MTRHPEPDDGTDVGTDELTGAGAGTVRDDRGHDGGPRTSTPTDDGGATAAAAREVADEDDDEPTRGE